MQLSLTLRKSLAEILIDVPQNFFSPSEQIFHVVKPSEFVKKSLI